MRRRISLLSLVAVLALLLVTPTWAATLYDNGPINGTIDAWTINFGFQVSDSFNLGSASNLTGAQIGLWAVPGDRPTSVDWSIGTAPFGSNIGSGTGSLTNTFQFTNSFSGSSYDILESTFPLSGVLGAGTYWLTLQNAVVPNNGIFWDQNNGPSQAWENVYGDLSLYVGPPPGGSESFQIFGSSTAVPEPATMLLLGGGLLGLAGYGRRRFLKR
jgi:hypothetical protein